MIRAVKSAVDAIVDAAPEAPINRAGRGDDRRTWTIGYHRRTVGRADIVAIAVSIFGQAGGGRQHGKQQGYRRSRAQGSWIDHCRLLSPDHLSIADDPDDVLTLHGQD